MIPPEIIALSPFAAERIAEAGRRRFQECAEGAPVSESHHTFEGGTAMNHTSSVSARLSGLAAAARVARIPVVCALIVALASDAAVSRVIALTVVIAAVAFGLALNAREIFLGRFASGEREPLATRLITSEEWAAQGQAGAR